MPKQLAALQKEYQDILKRADPMLDDMRKRAADMGSMHTTTGVLLMLGQGLEVLDERLKALGATHASDPVAANDPEVQEVLRHIAGLKATCRKISNEYWMNANRVGAISKEAVQLKTKVDAVIATKAAKLTQSKSLPGLQKLSVDLDAYARTLKHASVKGPKKPDFALFQ